LGTFALRVATVLAQDPFGARAERLISAAIPDIK
jgi:hypothetical protein